MAKIESKSVTVNAPAADVYAFLSDMNNIEQLLPMDKISDWKSTVESCSFKVQNAYTIGLQHNGGTPHSEVNYQSGPGSPFGFSLVCHLSEGNGVTTGHLVCDAQLNPFLEMMVKSPLKNLFDYMADKLAAKYNG